MKKIFLILLLIFLCGCSKGDNRAAIQDRLIKMEGYTADVEINYITKDGDNIYKAKEYAQRDGKYKIVTYYPEKFKNNWILFDGNMIWLYNPNVENKISVSAGDKPERSQLILFSFLENYVKDKSTIATAKTEEGSCTLLETEIIGGNKFIAKESLWVNNETQNPQRLVIYDEKGEERIIVNFLSFEYNPKLDSNTFNPQQ